MTILNKKLGFYIPIIFCLLLFNSLTLTSNLNLLLSIPQAIIVFYYILRGKQKDATLLHLLFLVTSFSATSGLGEAENVINYSRLKLIGSIGVHQVLSFMIAFMSSKKTQAVKLPFFDLSFKVLLSLFSIASVIGTLGLIITDYYPSYFLAKVVYMTTLLVNMYMLKKNSDENLLEASFRLSLALIIVTPITTLITYKLGISVKYSVFDIPLSPDAFFFVPILLLGIFYDKKIWRIIVPLTIYSLLLLQAGRGGYFLILLAAATVFFYQVFLSKHFKEKFSSKIKFIRITISIIIGIIVISSLSLQMEGLAEYKIKNVTSLLSFLSFQGSIDDVGDSPYVRIAEFLNIINGNNIFHLIVGHGYGGYFTDNMNLFGRIDLYNGSYAPDVIHAGKFPVAHGAIPSILLYNGIIGLAIIVFLSIKSLRRISYSFFSFAGIIIFLYSLYFNHLLGTIAITMLFASEINLKEVKYEDIIY